MRFELTTSALPRRCSVRWSYRGDVPRAGLEPACADFKDRPGCPATHPGMEPSPGADPGLLPYRGRVTAVCDGKAPAQAMAVVSASRTNGSLRAYAGAGCPRREPDPHCSAPSTLRLLPNWATRTPSRHPVPTRAIRRTKAEPQPCAAAWAGESRFELELNGSEPIVLPGYTIPQLSARGGI